MRVHHVELWVSDLADAAPHWAWLFEALGWTAFQDWSAGRSWRGTDGAYVVLEESPDLRRDVPYDRTRVGLNHLALAVPDRATVDRLAADGPAHGWQLLFADRHPHAGGPDHYAVYLADAAGFEVEVVAEALTSAS